MDTHVLTQVEVAKVFGVSQPAVFKWLKNSVPTAETVSTIAQYFGISADDLLYGHDPKTVPVKNPPTASEVEEMFRKLPPSTQHSVMRTVFKASLQECDVHLTEADLNRGWVEALLQYKLPDMDARYPTKVRIVRLSTTQASSALTQAIARRSPNEILIPSLPASFLKAMPKDDPLRMLTPFCAFALVRVAVRLNFGDAVADKVLRDLGLSFYMELLSEHEEPTF